MSEIEIGSGGKIAVSVALLRDQAAALARVHDRLGLVADSLASAGGALAFLGDSDAFVASATARALCERGEAFRAGLEQAADTYEYAEWMATAEAHSGVDGAIASAYGQRLAQAEASAPAVFRGAQQLFAGRGSDPLAAVGQELLVNGTTRFALLAALFAQTQDSGSWSPTLLTSAAPAGQSFVPNALHLPSTQGATRTGRAEPGVFSPVGTDAAVAARLVSERPVTPQALDLGGMLDTLPAGADVSITSYEFDGGREHILAIHGTDNWLPLGSDDVLDLESNLELFLAQDSALREAVGQAMADTGVLSTERVTVVGYSQGAMGALAEASDQRFAIGEVITLGSPQDLWLPDHVRHVDLAHLNDPVAALAAAGWATSGLGGRDLTIRGAGGHGTGTYRETARKADATNDPRIRQLHSDWQRFGDAKAAVRREYELERTAGK